MEKNCKVKVKMNGQWRKGILLDPQTGLVGVGEPYYFNYEEKTFSLYDLKEFIELSPEQEAEKIKQELAEAFKLTQDALAVLLPDEKVEILDQSISSPNYGLTLDPVTQEVVGLNTIEEYVAWQVTYWKYCPGDRVCPPDYDAFPIGEPLPYRHAVQKFIEQIFITICQYYWERKAEDALATEMNELNQEP